MRSPVQSWVSLLSKNTENEALAVKMQVLFFVYGLSGNVVAAWLLDSFGITGKTLCEEKLRHRCYCDYA